VCTATKETYWFLLSQVKKTCDLVFSHVKRHVTKRPATKETCDIQSLLYVSFVAAHIQVSFVGLFCSCVFSHVKRHVTQRPATKETCDIPHHVAARDIHTCDMSYFTGLFCRSSQVSFVGYFTHRSLLQDISGLYFRRYLTGLSIFPAKETCKRDLQKRPAKETCKRDL